MTPSGTVTQPTTFAFAAIQEGMNRAGVGDNGTVSIEPTTAGQLGQFERVVVTGAGAAPTVTNGMVDAWMWDQREGAWLTYGANGFAVAGDTTTVTSAGTAVALTASSATAASRLLLTGSSTTAVNSFTLAAGVTLNTYSLHITGNTSQPTNITLGTAADSTAKIVIGSGGIITGNNNATITPGLVFGPTGTAQAVFHVGGSTLTIGDNTNPTTSGQIQASNILKDGPGVLNLDSEQGTFSGAIALNGGSLTLNNRTASNSGASNAGGKGGTIYMNGYGTTLTLNAGSTAAGGSFNNSVYIAAGNPLVTINVNRIGSTSGQSQLGGNGGLPNTGNLTFGGSSGDQGQTLIIGQANSQTFRVNGTTDLGPTGECDLCHQYRHVPGGRYHRLGDLGQGRRQFPLSRGWNIERHCRHGGGNAVQYHHRWHCPCRRQSGGARLGYRQRKYHH
ncbi:MAG: hypothetical protein WDN28_13200 [Chthoniobacter sp.]